MSKHRFLSAQMQAYLRGGLWLDLATRANSTASKLALGLSALPYVRFDHQSDANIIFARWPRAYHQRLHNEGAYYYLNEEERLEGAPDEMVGGRLVCSWATTD